MFVSKEILWEAIRNAVRNVKVKTVEKLRKSMGEKQMTIEYKGTHVK